jgi:hypothetical protein
MNLRRAIILALGMAFGGAVANAATLVFTCDPTIDAAVAGTCNTLNTTISGLYGSTFSNAGANIYIKYGTTGLGESTTGFSNDVTYSAFLAALTATASGDAIDVAALAALNTFDTPIYGGGNVDITSALGTAIGITGLTGTTADGSACTVGTAGCYNGIITITNDPSTLLYFRNGVEDPSAYDFFSVVEHEVDEVLGTSSCISTTGATLTNTCPGTNTPSAVDLFRYASAGNLVLLDSTPGAYFSYNGGATNGAGGAVYNTLSNGDDYADFLTGCPSMTRIQDGTDCPGQGGLDITNDGGAEIAILDAIGFNQNAVPEPGTTTLFGVGLVVLVVYRARRRV